MPTDASLRRLALGGSAYYPSGGGYRGSRLIDLIMARGDQQAQAARQQGEIWGNAFQNIGQTVSGAISGAAEAQEAKARSKAIQSAISDPELMKNPQAAFARLYEIGGPELGPKLFQGVAGAAQLSQPKRDKAADTKAVVALGDSLAGLTPQERADFWPNVRPLVNSAFGTDLPEQYDENLWQKVYAPTIQGMKEKPEAYTLSPGQTRFEGDKVVAAVPPEAPKPEGPRVVGRSLVGPDGKVIYRDPLAPAAPREPRLVQVETVGPDGKPVTQFVEPTAGASYPKPSGQGKPATGQQRRALNFFNRGKEAEEIASSLEEGQEISPTKLKYVPDFANVVLSDANQAYRQAQRTFTEARLRKESGATIKDDEYENDARTYFAQPGDSEATKAQKRALRRAVLSGIGFESGDALREFYGPEAEGMLEEYKSGGQAARRGGAPTVPRRGERRTIDGQLAEWDGQGWLAVP